MLTVEFVVMFLGLSALAALIEIGLENLLDKIFK